MGLQMARLCRAQLTSCVLPGWIAHLYITEKLEVPGRPPSDAHPEALRSLHWSVAERIPSEGRGRLRESALPW